MTEDEWFTGADFGRCVGFVRGRGTDRKKRLYACAYFRAFWDLLVSQDVYFPYEFRELNRWVPAAVAVSEAFADGAATTDQLWAARAARGGPHNIALDVCRTNAHATLNVFAASVNILRESDLRFPVNATACVYLHEVMGNPFRPVPIAPAWLTWNDDTVRKLAQTVYDDRRYDLLPILADALEEAGCGNTTILAHCRGPGPHARGCWVVDLLLRKA
jgi:hypothetical protein